MENKEKIKFLVYRQQNKDFLPMQAEFYESNPEFSEQLWPIKAD